MGIAPSDRDYFTVNIRGTLYRLCGLPMGWSLSPYYFTTFTMTFVKHLPSPTTPAAPGNVLRSRRWLRRGGWRGARVLPYVDDFFLLASSEPEALELRQRVADLLNSLGLQRNPAKKLWEPVQCSQQLGVDIDTATGAIWSAGAKAEVRGGTQHIRMVSGETKSLGSQSLPSIIQLLDDVADSEQLAELVYEVYEEPEGMQLRDLSAVLEHYGVQLPETVVAGLFEVLDQEGSGNVQCDPFCQYFPLIVAVLRRDQAAKEQAAEAVAAEAAESISGLNVKPKDVAYFQRVFDELDRDSDGLVSWDCIRRKVPSLPKEPFKATGLTVESQLSMPQLLRLLHPEITEEDASIMASRTASTKMFVLPEEMRQLIDDLFETLDTDHDGLLSARDVVWNAPKMGQTVAEVSKTYVKLFVDAERSRVNRDEFTNWYIEEMLSTKFKEENMQTKSATLIK
eukprot:jgi/Tetstr1/455161/TSEL_042011.t1